MQLLSLSFRLWQGHNLMLQRHSFSCLSSVSFSSISVVQCPLTALSKMFCSPFFFFFWYVSLERHTSDVIGRRYQLQISNMFTTNLYENDWQQVDLKTRIRIFTYQTLSDFFYILFQFVYLSVSLLFIFVTSNLMCIYFCPVLLQQANFPCWTSIKVFLILSHLILPAKCQHHLTQKGTNLVQHGQISSHTQNHMHNQLNSYNKWPHLYWFMETSDLM